MDPLAQLHDIILPPEPGLWPLAWGWWLLLALVVLTLALTFWFWRRQRQRTAYRKAALAELQALNTSYQLAPNTAQYLQGLAVLLRRTAIAAHPRSFPRDIQGQAWLDWLDQQCPQIAPGFSQGPGQALLTGPYQAAPQADIPALQALAKRWLAQHRNQWQNPGQKAVQAQAQHTQAREEPSHA
jgi:hypothetical protein